jgi:hypothetical protein
MLSPALPSAPSTRYPEERQEQAGTTLAVDKRNKTL